MTNKKKRTVVDALESTSKAMRESHGIQRARMRARMRLLSDVDDDLFDADRKRVDIIRELHELRESVEVDRAIYNGPVTVIVWKDGSKTKTRCQEGDVYSRETGFMMCVVKKMFPNWRDVMAQHVWSQE